ncbi:Hsp70 protein-domain-containing protein [Aspergillus spectabilis]
MTRPPRSRPTRISQGTFASLSLFLLLFVLKTKACGGWDGPKEKLIGIHFGRFNLRVGSIQDGQITILTDRAGGDSTDTYVGVFDDRPGTGDGAASLAMLSPNIFEAAMANSRQRAENLGIFKQTDLDVPPPTPPPKLEVTDLIHLEFNETEYAFRPDEIYGPILAKLLKIAESHIGGNITGAVVTIPPFFTDADREDLKRAGESIGLPIIRQMHESTSMILALGLDEISYEADRYVLLAEIRAHGVDLSVIEIDMGIVDRLATVKTKLLFNQGADISPVIDEVLGNANLSRSNITDLIIFNSPPSYYDVHRSLTACFPDARIANTPDLDRAGIWGATLVSGWISGESDSWVPCCCATRQPPIYAELWANSTGTGYKGILGYLDVLNECQPPPMFDWDGILMRCGEDFTVKVYMQDLPCVDYHAMYELGDDYIPEKGAGSILLGEFSATRNCAPGKEHTAMEVAAFVSRQGELKVMARNQDMGESGVITFKHPHFACGDEKRFAKREYTYTLGGDLGEEYRRDLRGFVGPDRDQKPTDAFVAFEFLVD